MIGVGPTQIEYNRLAPSQRLLSRIMDHQPNPANRNRKILRLAPMSLPPLDHAGKYLGEIALAKPYETFGIRAQHMQHGTPLVDDLSELRDVDSCDAPRSHSRVHGSDLSPARRQYSSI